MGTSFNTEMTIYPIFAFIGIILVSIPLYWHLEAWNTGCVLYILWVATGCLVRGINTIIWRDNAINWAPIWGDISTRLAIGVNVGVPVATLVIIRRLYIITNITSISSRAQKCRDTIIDLALGLGIPLLQIILYWVIQGHRFDIYEGFGPVTVVPNTYLAWFLYNFWNPVIVCISVVYCGMTLWQFRKRYQEFQEFLTSTNISLNLYYRLISLVILQSLCMIPLAAYTLWADIHGPIYQWHGFADLHFDFSRTSQIPAIEWEQIPGMRESFEFNDWLLFAEAVVFFLFFGFAAEARRHYRMAFASLKKRLGISNSSKLIKFGISGVGSTRRSIVRLTLPSFVQHPQQQHHRSTSSLSDTLSLSISIGAADDEKWSSTLDSGFDEYLSTPDGEKYAHGTRGMSVPGLTPAVAVAPV